MYCLCSHYVAIDNGNTVVDGRQLHEVLKLNSNYTTWFNRMCEYGFEENIDYYTVFQKRKTAQGNETEFINHVLNLDMAKEISMIQRSEVAHSI